MDALLHDELSKSTKQLRKLQEDPFDHARGKAKKKKKPVEAGKRRATEEAHFQPRLDQWVSKNKHLFSTSCLFELKVSDTDSIPFNKLQEHQKESLMRCEGEGEYHRITTNKQLYESSTGTIVQKDTKKPGDSFLIKGRGYVCVMFHVKHRGNKTFYMIRIGDWVDAEANSTRKSLTEAQAAVIGKKCSL